MKVTGFGDYLIHFSPLEYERLYQAELMRVCFTGAEENVCAALAFWGESTAFVTRLPDHPLADRAVAVLRSFGIDTRYVVRGGERMGAYYLEKGASVRASRVIYDRAHSGFTEAKPDDFDFDGILADTDVLYLTGITPALGGDLPECVRVLCRKAAKKGISVVYDVNYRPTLSSPEQAGAVLRELAPSITTLIGNEEHLKLLTGILPSAEAAEKKTGDRLLPFAEALRAQLGIRKIAVTVRRTLSASDALVYAAYFKDGDFAVSPMHRIHVVDRVGSGDAFSAGLIYGELHGFSAAQTVSFAAASSAVKHTIMGDTQTASVAEIEAVQREAFDVSR